MRRARFPRRSDFDPGPIGFALKKALQAKHGPAKGPKMFAGVVRRLTCDAVQPADIDRHKAAVMAELGKMTWNELCSAIKHFPDATKKHLVKLHWDQMDHQVQKK
jgi:hypothetical protein